MKYSFTLLAIFALLGAIHSEAADVLPSRFNFDRYSTMEKQSPFAIATAVALPAATPNFAKDLYVANAAASPEGDLVTIASTSDQNFKKYLTTKEPVDGYSIANIEWSDRVGATKVTISKDGNFATLTFNEALLSQRGPNRPPQMRPLPNPNMPGAAALQGAMPGVSAMPAPLVPPSAPLQVPPRPRVRGMIRNPKAGSTPNLGGRQPNKRANQRDPAALPVNPPGIDR
jgi:hypothetical protein